MTEWYCHFDPNEFAQARKVQENLLQPEGYVQWGLKFVGIYGYGTCKKRDCLI
jgi:hypothetical protein